MSVSGFLSFAGYRYAKAATALSAGCIVWYALDTPPLGARGDTVLGYTLGTLAGGLVLLLLLLGVRRRAYASRMGTLRGWLSAHVYLGLSLVVVASLHAAFSFGWNVHTLAFALTLTVVASGVWGVAAYARNPELMGGLLDGRSLEQHVSALHQLDAQARRVAADLDPEAVSLVEAAARAPLLDGPFARLRRARGCPTRHAVRASEGRPGEGWQEFHALMYARLVQLTRLRQFLRLKSLTSLWLLVHVPLSFALLGSLIAHVVSVFFYW